MPDGWKEHPVAELLALTIGGLWGEEPGVNEVDVLVGRSTEFRKDGSLNLSTAVTRSVSRAQLTSRRLIPGDILLEKSGGGPQQPVGRVVQVLEAPVEPLICSNFVQLVRPNSSLVLPRFLLLSLWLTHAQGGTLTFQAQTTGIRNLRTTDYLNRTIMVPPLQDQRRIVDLISALDRSIDAASVVALVAEQSATTLIDDTIDKSESYGPLGDYSTIRGGKRLPAGTPWNEGPTTHPYIRVTDLRGGRVAEEDLVFVPDSVWPAISRYVVEAGDVIISIVGTIGAVAQVPRTLGGANLTENAALIRTTTDLAPDFLAACLRSNYGQSEIQRLTVGTTQKKLALFRIAQFEMPILPVSLQRKVAMAYETLDEMAHLARGEGSAMRELRVALLAELLSGERIIPDTYDALLQAS